LGLLNLMLDLRCGDMRKQLAGLHVVTDINVALVDIAAGAGEDIGLSERRRRGRQSNDHGGIARLDGGDAELGHIVLMLRGGIGNLPMLLTIAPSAETKPG
jgi:hypothetical protein